MSLSVLGSLRGWAGAASHLLSAAFLQAGRQVKVGASASTTSAATQRIFRVVIPGSGQTRNVWSVDKATPVDGRLVQYVRNAVPEAEGMTTSRDEAFCVRHSNPFATDTGNEPIVEAFRNGTRPDRLAFRGKHRGFHGTSLESLARIGGVQQLFGSRVMADVGMPIYFDNPDTAVEYALRSTYTPVGYSSWMRSGAVCQGPEGECMIVDQPVVLAVSSDVTPEVNDTVTNPGLFDYHYFPAGQGRVYVDGLWLLNPHTHPTRSFEASRTFVQAAGLGMANRLMCCAVRNLFKQAVVRYC